MTGATNYLTAITRVTSECALHGTVTPRAQQQYATLGDNRVFHNAVRDGLAQYQARKAR